MKYFTEHFRKPELETLDNQNEE